MTSQPALTAHAALKIARIVQGCIDHARIGRARDDSGVVVTGTMRAIHVSPMNAYAPAESTDVRDCYAHITMSSGLEAWWPLTEMVAEIGSGMLVVGFSGHDDPMTAEDANTTYEGYEAWRKLHEGEIVTHDNATGRFTEVPEDTVRAWAERFIMEHGNYFGTRPYSSPVAAMAAGDSSRYTATSGRRADRKE